MSREQAAKVTELLAQGWKSLAPPHPLPGAPVPVQDLQGKKWLVDAAGDVSPAPEPQEG